MRHTFSLHASSSGYVELEEEHKYLLTYTVKGGTSGRRFEGAVFKSYNLVENVLVFVTPKGYRITVPPAQVSICLRVD